MNQPRCIITGCALIDGSRWAWGDLHEFGSVYIFNAAADSQGGTLWQPGAPSPGSKAIDMPQAQLFERRGVFVIWHDISLLNDEARRYIA